MLQIAILPCSQIIVGNGEDYSQHIPCDPFYNHSLSQLIYDVDYFPYSGTITQLAFEYNFVTPNPQNFLNNITIMLGETSQTEFTDGDDWLDLEQLTLCYEGVLTAANFTYNSVEDINLLLIPLQNYFYYSKNSNLVILFLENESTRGANADDFIAFTTPRATSLCLMDLNNPIDINNLGTAQFVRNRLPNTRFEFTIDESYPVPLFPENNSVSIELTASLQVIAPQDSNLEFMLRSDAASENFEFIADYEILGDSLWVISPQLPFSPNTLYEWQVINTLDDSIYNSELFSFTTIASELSLSPFAAVNDHYSVELSWQSLFANDFPYHIFRNGGVIASPENNSWIDQDVEVGQSYSYKVRFYFVDGTFLESGTLMVDTSFPQDIVIDEDFTGYNAWTTDIGNWQNIDNDQASTYGLADYSYPNWSEASAFVVFEPSSVTPPLDIEISGNRCLVSFASCVPPTSDLLISPNFRATQVDVDIFLKSYDSSWGLERIKCGLIFNNDTLNQYSLEQGNSINIPAEMTHLNFSYCIDTGSDMITNFWLESCGVQSSMLIINRIVISSSATGNADNEVSSPNNAIYPNPITGNEFDLTNTRGLQQLAIYNIKGQLVAKLNSYNINKNGKIKLPHNISSGVYLVKINYSDREEVQKITVMK